MSREAERVPGGEDRAPWPTAIEEATNQAAGLPMGPVRAMVGPHGRANHASRVQKAAWGSGVMQQEWGPLQELCQWP